MKKLTKRTMRKEDKIKNIMLGLHPNTIKELNKLSKKQKISRSFYIRNIILNFLSKSNTENEHQQ